MASRPGQRGVEWICSCSWEMRGNATRSYRAHSLPTTPIATAPLLFALNSAFSPSLLICRWWSQADKASTPVWGAALGPCFITPATTTITYTMPAMPRVVCTHTHTHTFSLSLSISLSTLLDIGPDGLQWGDFNLKFQWPSIQYGGRPRMAPRPARCCI